MRCKDEINYFTEDEINKIKKCMETIISNIWDIS
jgi:hypothetical protein